MLQNNTRAPRRHRFEITENELSAPHFDPRHDGLRIAQLSDLHLGGNTPKERIRAAIQEVNDRAPELVFLTGDYVTYTRGPLREFASLLEGIKARTFAVLGNHDHGVAPSAIKRALEQLSYTVLQNSHQVIELRGAPLTILGIDDGKTGHDDVEETFRGAPAGGTRLVLTHSPPTAEKLPAHQGLLCFSGHTHGGQIIIPRITEALSRRMGQPYLRGLYPVRGNQLYVNRGLGFGLGSRLPRIGSEPELAFFTLRISTR